MLSHTTPATTGRQQPTNPSRTKSSNHPRRGESIKIDDLLSRLNKVTPNGDGWMACCPAHADKTPSLSIGTGDDGRILVNCFAGCTPESICSALTITTAYLMPTPVGVKPHRNGNGHHIVATYDYTDATGKLVYQVCRMDPKDFRQRKPDGNGGWIWNTKGIERVPYRLPELQKAVQEGRPILIAEGEKDVDRLIKEGLAATCNDGGAGKWRDGHSKYLAGATVVIIADKDEAGRKHAARVAKSLTGISTEIRIIELPDLNGKPVKDASDFFNAGGTPPQLNGIPDAPAQPVEDDPGETAEDDSRVPQFNEFVYANKLAEILPPIQTVGINWFAYREGAWVPTKRDIFRPKAQQVLPEPLRTARREGNLLDQLQGRFQVEPDSFRGFYRLDESNAVLINANNGIVRVTEKSMELIPHCKDHQFTRKTAANFNPDAKCLLFMRILSEILPNEDDRELVRLCCGNFLLPDCRHEVALVWYGEANRGKSTLSAPIESVFGRSLVSRVTMAKICDPDGYSLPGLQFSALNLGTELDVVAVDESANFKTLVSGEPVEARSIYGEPFNMQTSCKLWFLANSLPRFKHGTEAELRRMRFIRFDYKPPQNDVTLKDRLLLERDGIFNFMLDGLQMLLGSKSIPMGSRESSEVHERFKISNDPVGSFVDQRCQFDPSGHIAKQSLINAYGEYCDLHGLPPSNQEWLCKRLYERFPAVKPSRKRVGADREPVVSGLVFKPLVSM